MAKVALPAANHQTIPRWHSYFLIFQQIKRVGIYSENMEREQSLTRRTAVVITVSDRCFGGTQVDVSGPTVAEVLSEAGADVPEALVVPDEAAQITDALKSAAARADLVITTGGTGLATRDVTPEATLAACDRLVPGLSELMRREGMHHTPFAALSRGVCGTIGRCLVINLPGSPKGAKTSLRLVLPLLSHALDLLGGHTEHPTVEQQDR